ncbi:MAG: SDR family NAD(P)-dependent oxidoreductase [Deltaproteobacteria bacterium]|nr:SDR family NAD(P)-dependent oxidoreductase [Deltaproteobacteria bacterium]
MDAKVVVVTGGARGIGRATALRFSEEGYIPVILDRDAEAGAAAASLLEAKRVEGRFIQADLTDKAEVAAAFERILSACGRIDILVNLAGGTFHKGAIQDVTPAQWKECVDLNLKTTFLCSQAAIAPMKQAGRGVIVNTASNFGVTGGAERTHYAAAKAAIIAFSKSLATELAPHGIRVNTIAPGLTGTDRVRGKYDADEWAKLSGGLPMGRAATPEEIADGIFFLATDESDYVTGATLHVNGGMVMP